MARCTDIWGSVVSVLGGRVSNGARAGLTGFVAGLSRQVAEHGVTINNLLPGPFNTDRIAQTLAGMAEKQGRSLEEVMAERKAENPMSRFGEASEFGAYCAFLCSVQAGYVTGQNLLMDGGAYPGTL